MSEIIEFPGGTKADIPVANVLEGAQDLASVIVIGYDKQGNEYFASSTGNAMECAWLAGRYIKLLMENEDEIY